MKKIVLLITTIFLIGQCVLADTDIQIDVITNQDVNFWANCYTNGTCNYMLDGSYYPDYVDEKISGLNRFNVWDMVKHIENTVNCMLGTKKHCSEWHYRIGNALNAWFLPRVEYQKELRDTQIRLAMLEKTVEQINATAFCSGKIAVMQDYGLDWIMCGDIKYHNINGKGIAITGAE